MILRVFPRRNSHTPTDPWVCIGLPGLWKPAVDEVHVSIAFTWDKERGERLQREWANYYPIVKLGGPGIDGEGNRFEPGMYLKAGITITTRGCPNSCPFCSLKDVPFREIEIKPGWIIQDNNILAASKTHFRKVIDMLNVQPRATNFRGGLEIERLTAWHIEELQKLRKISELWFAADKAEDIKYLTKAKAKLKWLNRRKLRCYVLCAYANQTIEQAKVRLERVWELGFLPFAQLYQPRTGQIRYNEEWRSLAREWSRPALMKKNHPGS